MKNIILGVVGALVGSAAVFAAWLFWPMPSAAVDWQALADDQLADGACAEFRQTFLALPSSQLVKATEYLDGRTANDWCADLTTDPQAIDAEQARFEEAVRAAADRNERLGWKNTYHLGGFWDSFDNSGGSRRGGVMYLSDLWFDLAIAARCDNRLRGDWAEWLNFRTFAAPNLITRDLIERQISNERTCISILSRYRGTHAAGSYSHQILGETISDLEYSAELNAEFLNQYDLN